MEFPHNEYRLTLKSGQIESIVFKESTYDFSVLQPEYRQNEYLAIEKEKFTESWILYNYLKKKYSQKYTDLYLDSVEKLIKELGF